MKTPSPKHFRARAEFYRRLALSAHDEKHAGDMLEVAAVFCSLANDIARWNHAKESAAREKRAVAIPGEVCLPSIFSSHFFVAPMAKLSWRVLSWRNRFKGPIFNWNELPAIACKFMAPRGYLGVQRRAVVAGERNAPAGLQAAALSGSVEEFRYRVERQSSGAALQFPIRPLC